MYSPPKLSDLDPVPITTRSSSPNFTDSIFSPDYINTMQPYGAADVSYLNSIERQLSQLTNQLESLQTTVATVQARQIRPLFRQRSRSRPRSRSPKRTSEICWYHTKFGTKARRCTRPCAFPSPSTDNQGNGPARQ